MLQKVDNVVAFWSIYVIFFIAGSLFGNQLLSTLGAVSFFLLTILTNFQGIFKTSISKRLLLMQLAFSGFVFISYMANLNSSSLLDMIKIEYFPAVLLLLCMLHGVRDVLTRVNLNIINAEIVFILLVSLVLGRYFVLGGNSRPSGLFSNPNNLALFAFTALFFADQAGTSFKRKSIVSIAVMIIILTETSGALIGLLVFLFLSIYNKYSKRLHLIIPLVGIAVLLVAIFNIRIVSQLKVIYKALQESNILQDAGSFDFSMFGREYGSDSMSGIWRIVHWTNSVVYWLNSGTLAILIGNGPGSSRIILGLYPHNDYIRLFFEFGTIGFVLFGLLIASIYKQIETKYQPVFAAVLVYAFSENILTNLLFCTAFAFGVFHWLTPVCRSSERGKS